MGKKALDKNSKPPHLSPLDWRSSEHKRFVAACLVQGTYRLEEDRQRHRQGPEALSPVWWENFHFKLVDKADSSIFGAIYEPNSAAASRSDLGTSPKSVIAFRGTLTKWKSLFRDFELDFHIFINRLHKKSRSKDALDCARDVVTNVGHENIWLVGHSLGATLALFVGKNLSMEATNVTTFLFNPPFVALPIERLRLRWFKHAFRSVIDVINAVAFNIVGKDQTSDESFAKMCSWVPKVFVNPRDSICSTYIAYFENREEMEKTGLGDLWRLAVRNSLRDMFLQALRLDSNSLHKLPSAYLIVNDNHAKRLSHAHTIDQWLHPQLGLTERPFLYNAHVSSINK